MSHRLTTRLATFTARRACTRCNRVGHLATTCRAPVGRIDRLGVEIEGWWLHDRRAEVTATATRIGAGNMHDGSLASDSTGETYALEYQTRAGSLGSTLASVHALYPDKVHATAGMHVHLSLRDPADGILLLSREFSDYALARWRAWGEREQVNPGSQFWERLDGNNRYCLPLTDEDISRGTRCDRFRWLNFSAWNKRNRRTIELRLLPLFGQERLAHSAISEWVEIVESYLARPGAWGIEVTEAEVPAAEREDIAIEAEVVAEATTDATAIETEAEVYAVPPLRDGERRATTATAARVFATLMHGGV